MKNGVKVLLDSEYCTPLLISDVSRWRIKYKKYTKDRNHLLSIELIEGM